MQFRAVLFDAGDILFDATDWRRWLFEELRTLGKASTYRALWDPWDERYLPKAHLGRAQWDDLFRQYMNEIGVTGDRFFWLQNKSQEKQKELYPTRKAFSGVPETLARMRDRGVKTGVLSDTESSADKVTASLGRLGMEGMFDAVVTSIDIGFCKPAPEAFRAALRALGTGAKDTVFVAHDPDEILGAADFGLDVIAFNSHDPRGATWVAARFEEIADIVLGNGSRT